MKEIPLTQGKVAIVDDDMYDYLMQWSWYASQTKKTWYVRRSEGHKKIYMHRQIMQAPKGFDVDHRDGNGLHNWRENLRVCSHQHNTMNRPGNTGRAGYKGAYYHKRDQCWRAQIQVDRRAIFLGSFDTAEDAAIAYNQAALERFGEFAFFNDVPNWRMRTPKRRPGYEQIRSNPASGHKHITWHQRKSKWCATIPVNGKRVHLGYFDTVEDAVYAQTNF